MYKKAFLVVMVSVSLFLIGMVEAIAIEPVRLVVDGEEICFSDTDGKLYVDGDGRTQTPIRRSMESIGVRVLYENADKSVLLTKDDVSIKLTVGSDRAVINGSSLLLGAEVSIIDGRSYLPARVIFERFGYDVRWDSSDRTVSVVTSGNTKNEQVALVWSEPSHFTVPMGYHALLGVDLNLLPFQQSMTASEFTELFYNVCVAFINTSSDSAILLESNGMELQIFKLAESAEDLIIKYNFSTYEGVIPPSSVISAQFLNMNVTLTAGHYKIKYIPNKLFVYRNASNNEIYADYLSELSRFGVQEVVFDIFQD